MKFKVQQPIAMVVVSAATAAFMVVVPAPELSWVARWFGVALYLSLAFGVTFAAAVDYMREEIAATNEARKQGLVMAVNEEMTRSLKEVGLIADDATVVH